MSDDALKTECLLAMEKLGSMDFARKTIDSAHDLILEMVGSFQKLLKDRELCIWTHLSSYLQIDELGPNALMVDLLKKLHNCEITL